MPGIFCLIVAVLISLSDSLRIVFVVIDSLINPALIVCRIKESYAVCLKSILPYLVVTKIVSPFSCFSVHLAKKTFGQYFE